MRLDKRAERLGANLHAGSSRDVEGFPNALAASAVSFDPPDSFSAIVKITVPSNSWAFFFVRAG